MAKTSERYFVYSSDCDIDQDEEERLLGFGSDEEDSGLSISESMENQLLGNTDVKLDQTYMVKSMAEDLGKSDEPVGTERADVLVRLEIANKVTDATEHPKKSEESIDLKLADVPVGLELANNTNRRVKVNDTTIMKVHDINNNQILGSNEKDVREAKVKIEKDEKTIATGKAKRKAKSYMSMSSLELVRGESLRMRKQKDTDVIPNSGKTDSYLTEIENDDILELDEVERQMVEQIADADDLLDEIDTFLNVESAKQKYDNHKDTGTKSVKASDKDMTALILKRFGSIDNFLDKMDEFFNVTCEKPENRIHDVEDIDKTDGVSDERNTATSIPKRRINRLKQPEVRALSRRNDDIIEAPTNDFELSNEATDKSIEPTSIRNGCEIVKITAVPKDEHETVALPVKSCTDENESRIAESITDSSNSSSDDDLSMKSASASSSEIYDTTVNDCRIVKLSRAFDGDEKETENVELDLTVSSSREDIQSMKSASSTSTETFPNTEDEYNAIKPSVDSHDVNSYSIESASWTSAETPEIDEEHHNHGDIYPEQDDVLTVDDGYDMWQAYYSGTEYAFDATEQSENRAFYGVAESGYDVETIDHHTVMHEYETEAILNNSAMASNDVKPRFIFINPAKMPPKIDVNVDGNIESPEYDIEFA